MRGIHDVAGEVMAHVERVRALVAIEVGRVRPAGFGLNGQLRQQRRVVEALAERVLHVERESLLHALGRLHGHRLEVRRADRLHLVDVVETRIQAGRGVHRGAVDRPAIGERAGRINQVHVGDDGELIALRIHHAQ